MNNVQTQAELIAACRAAIDNGNPFANIELIMQHLVTLPEEVLKDIMYTDSEDVVSSIYISPDISIRKIVMPPHFHGQIHDHNIWTIGGVIKGEEDNIYYQETEQGLIEDCTSQTKANTCFTMGKDIIHGVRNNLDEPTVSLHIYGGDLMQAQKYIWHPLTFEKIPYDYAKACEFAKLMTAQIAPMAHLAANQ